jgi:hypothetical protein
MKKLREDYVQGMLATILVSPLSSSLLCKNLGEYLDLRGKK